MMTKEEHKKEKNIVKKLFSLLGTIALAASLCCGISACGGKEPNPTETPSVTVSVTTEQPTPAPTAEPTPAPTTEPTIEPTTEPTEEPLPQLTFADKTVTYTGDAHYLAVEENLPDGVTVTYENNGKTDVGTYTVTAIVSVRGAKRAELTATLKIEKATYDMSGVGFSDETVTYDKNEHSVRAKNLPDGVTVTYENNGKTEVGTYPVTAHFTGDSKNYERIEDKTVTLTIEKRVLEVEFTGETTFRYDGNAHKELSAAVEGVLSGDRVGVELAYDGDVIEEGEYVVTAAMTEESNPNYALSETSRYTTVTITRETHRVRFLQEGQDPREFAVKDLAAFTEIPEVIAVEGYRISWEDFDLSCVTEDVTVNAIIYKLYYVHYDANGGILPEGNPTEYIETEEFSLQRPSGSEYTFGGWRVVETGETIIKIEKGAKRNFNLVAIWDRLEYYEDPNNKNQYYVSGIIGSEPLTTIEIPDEHITHPVVGILGDMDLSGVVSVKFGKNIRTLNGGLSKASGLKYIFVSDENQTYRGSNNCLIEKETGTLVAGGQFDVFPQGVKKIGASAFAKREWITEMTLPEGVTEIGVAAFSGCKNLRQITFPETLERVGAYSFTGCYALEQAVIPDAVTEVAAGAFEACKSLRSVTLGSGLTTIGDEAFWECALLTEIRIPAGVTSLGHNNPFAQCTSLETIEVDPGNTTYRSQNNCVINISKNTLIAGTTVTGSTRAEVPAGTEILGSYAFDSCGRMTSISLPNSLRSIRMGAFLGCDNLADIRIVAGGKLTASGNCIIDAVAKTVVYGNAHSVIPSDGSVTIIGDNAFVESKITTLVLPAAVTTIRSGAFSFCSELTSVDFGGVTVIGQNAFQSCTSLKSVTIPAGVKTLESSTFAFCEELTEISLPAGLSSVGYSALMNCAKLKTIRFGGTVAEWKTAIKGAMEFDTGTGDYTVICADGTIAKA